MAEAPAVSVIVPVHGGEQFLAAALDSVARQTHRPAEVLVVDDGSPDRSAEIAEGYDGVRVLRQARSGVGAARNAGVRAARGELLAFLDQDDCWAPERLARQIAVLHAQPEVDLALCHIEMVLLDGTPRPEWFTEGWLTEPQPGWVPSTWLVRREAFERVGPFDPGYEIACDTDWLARFKDAGLASTMLPDVLVQWRVHGANGSYDRDTMQRELLLVLRRSVVRQRETRVDR